MHALLAQKFSYFFMQQLRLYAQQFHRRAVSHSALGIWHLSIRRHKARVWSFTCQVEEAAINSIKFKCNLLRLLVISCA